MIATYMNHVGELISRSQSPCKLTPHAFAQVRALCAQEYRYILGEQLSAEQSLKNFCFFLIIIIINIILIIITLIIIQFSM